MFESPDNSANNLPADIGESRENFVNQMPADEHTSKSTKDIFKFSHEIPGEMSNAMESSLPVSTENKYNVENQNDPGIKNAPHITPVKQSDPDVMPSNHPIEVKHLRGSDQEDDTDSTPLKENHVIITNYNMIIDEEQAIYRSPEKIPDLTPKVRPVSSSDVKPFTSSEEFIYLADKSAGTLGEPPGAIGLNNISDHLDFKTNYPDITANPVIRVSIGQINVRAVSHPPAVSPQKSREVSKPLMSLEDYLKQKGKR
jgi:hypothetical protein